MPAPTATANDTPHIPALPRSMLLVIGGILAVLAAGVLLAITVGHRTETTYPPHSPLGTVSTYFRLLQDGKLDQAFTMTDLQGGPDTSTPMTREQFHQSFDVWSQQSHRVTLISATTSHNAASVMVEIHAFSAGALGPSDTTGRLTITLERRRGRWVITGPPYLYP